MKFQINKPTSTDLLLSSFAVAKKQRKEIRKAAEAEGSLRDAGGKC